MTIWDQSLFRLNAKRSRKYPYLHAGEVPNAVSIWISTILQVCRLSDILYGLSNHSLLWEKISWSPAKHQTKRMKYSYNVFKVFRITIINWIEDEMALAWLYIIINIWLTWCWSPMHTTWLALINLEHNDNVLQNFQVVHTCTRRKIALDQKKFSNSVLHYCYALLGPSLRKLRD